MPKYKTDYVVGNVFPLTRYDRHGIINKIKDVGDHYHIEVFDPRSGGLWYFDLNKHTGIRTYRAFINKEQIKARQK